MRVIDAFQILLVDDDRAPLILNQYLATEGFVIDVLHTGEEAIPAATNGPYNAVMLDITLPQISGTELLRRIRQVSDTLCGSLRASHRIVFRADPPAVGGNERLRRSQGRASTAGRIHPEPVHDHAHVHSCGGIRAGAQHSAQRHCAGRPRLTRRLSPRALQDTATPKFVFVGTLVSGLIFSIGLALYISRPTTGMSPGQPCSPTSLLSCSLANCGVKATATRSSIPAS